MSDFNDITKVAILFLEKKHLGFIINFGLFSFQKGWKIIILMGIFSLNNHQNSPVDEKSG